MAWDERKPRDKPLSEWRVKLETYIELNWKWWLFVIITAWLCLGWLFDGSPNDSPYPPRWN